MTYAGDKSDVEFEQDNRSIIVLGSGAYRIGSSVEFDWCGVQALKTIRKHGYRSAVMWRHGVKEVTNLTKHFLRCWLVRAEKCFYYLVSRMLFEKDVALVNCRCKVG
jgi:hypothetical protein